jgi:hypothetical protein
MNPLDLVTIDDSDFVLQGDEQGVRYWRHPAVDSFGLSYYPARADLDADLNDLGSVRAFYRKLAMQAGGGVVDVETPVIGQCRAVRTIIRVCPEPPSMVYLGAIMLPFRDFTYAFKSQYAEQGTTGLREAVVFNQLKQSGLLTDPPLSAAQRSGEGVYLMRRNMVGGWMDDPNDSAIETQLMRNRADAEEYDARFPDHPLSRVRLLLNHLQQSLRLSPQLRSAPHF